MVLRILKIYNKVGLLSTKYTCPASSYSIRESNSSCGSSKFQYWSNPPQYLQQSNWARKTGELEFYSTATVPIWFPPCSVYVSFLLIILSTFENFSTLCLMCFSKVCGKSHNRKKTAVNAFIRRGITTGNLLI